MSQITDTLNNLVQARIAQSLTPVVQPSETENLVLKNITIEFAESIDNYVDKLEDKIKALKAEPDGERINANRIERLERRINYYTS